VKFVVRVGVDSKDIFIQPARGVVEPKSSREMYVHVPAFPSDTAQHFLTRKKHLQQSRKESSLRIQ
jgi:hypothetical protein